MLLSQALTEATMLPHAAPWPAPTVLESLLTPIATVSRGVTDEQAQKPWPNCSTAFAMVAVEAKIPLVPYQYLAP